MIKCLPSNASDESAMNNSIVLVGMHESQFPVNVFVIVTISYDVRAYIFCFTYI